MGEVLYVLLFSNVLELHANLVLSRYTRTRNVTRTFAPPPPNVFCFLCWMFLLRRSDRFPVRTNEEGGVDGPDVGEDGGGAEELPERQGEGDRGAVLGAEKGREGGVPEAEEGEGQRRRPAGENRRL